MSLPPSHRGSGQLYAAAPPHSGLAGRLQQWREAQLARQCLDAAGEPGLVLDLPCGSGRFWPVLAEHANRVILAADHDPDQLSLAMSGSPAALSARVAPLKASAEAISLGNNAEDCIFCMRWFHHVPSSTQRLSVLREFHRISRDTVIISLWVDGNFRAWRRRRLEQRRLDAGQGSDRHNRFVVPRAQIEAEFRQAGFAIVDHHDLVPGYAMWRTYVLRKA